MVPSQMANAHKINQLHWPKAQPTDLSFPITLIHHEDLTIRHTPRLPHGGLRLGVGRQ